MDLYDFFRLARFIGEMVLEEGPPRILEISGGGTIYGRLLKSLQAYCGIQDGIVDRVVIPGSGGTGNRIDALRRKHRQDTREASFKHRAI